MTDNAFPPIWLDRALVDRLCVMRGVGESCSRDFADRGGGASHAQRRMFEFLKSLRDAAQALVENTRPHAKTPFRYGDEIDAILSACRDAQAEPWNEEAAIRLIRLAGSILNYHDAPPGSSGEAARLERMNALVRIVRSDLGDAEAGEVAALVPDLTPDTPKAETLHSS